MFFADATVFLVGGADNFFLSRLPRKLKEEGTSLILPYRCAREINNLQESVYPGKQEAARRAAAFIQKGLKEEYIRVMGSPEDPGPERLFHKLFPRHIQRRKIVLLTQNRELAGSFEQLVREKLGRIRIFYLREGGTPIPWHSFPQTPEPQIELPGELCSLLKNRPEVFGEKWERLSLEKELGRGGEGFIFLTRQGQVVKLYRKQKSSEEKEKKLRLMLKEKINYPGICWPQDIIKTPDGDFLGYLMPRGRGRPMQVTLFTKPALESNFPGWRRKHLVDLALEIVKRVEHLHRREIIIGDINPLNILVTPSGEVFFVDTDSYQLQGYPCPVGTINFTPPELQGKNYKTFLRSFEHDYFALATLLFMIFLPGKPPYSRQGGGTPVENINQQNFPYRPGNIPGAKVPAGQWQALWEALPQRMQEKFYAVFRENKRLSPQEWLQELNYYRKLLMQKGAEEKIFPAVSRSYYQPLRRSDHG